MNITLDPWQKEIKEHDGNCLLCTGRQVGKTTIFAEKAGDYMVKHPSSKIIAVSLTEDQAFLMRAMVEDYLKKEYPAYLKVAKKLKPTKNKIVLNNKSSYQVRPVGNTGDALRGFTGDVLIVDEAAFMPELMWSASKPTLLTTGGQIWMCSTPHVKQGWFYEQFEACRTNKSDRFKVWQISSEEVIYNRSISESWTESKSIKAKQFLEEEKSSMTEMRYAQEYLGLFMDDIMRYFPEDLIERCCTLSQQPRLHGREYYIGIDIARLGGDETAYEVIQKIDNNNLLHVYSDTEHHKVTTHTLERIYNLENIYNFTKIYIDAGAGSLGVGIFDQLMSNDRTKRKAVAVNNRTIVMGRPTFSGEKPSKQRLLKEDLYDNLRMLMEQNKIKLLNNDRVKLSLRSITFEVVKSKYGTSRISISGNYSHIAEGLIRAAYCSKQKNIKPFISSIRI